MQSLRLLSNLDLNELPEKNLELIKLGNSLKSMMTTHRVMDVTRANRPKDDVEVFWLLET